MTEAQIRYLQMRETQRHDVEQERNWSATLQETRRANQARETLSKYATDVQKWSTLTNAQTSTYVARVNAATQRYSAQMGYASSKYVADTNARTQRYVSDQNAAVQRSVSALQAAVSRYNVQQQTAAQRYSSDQAAAASRYATDRNYSMAGQRLEFDRQTQLVKNSLDSQRVQLQRIQTQADSEYKRAQVEKLASDIARSAQQLALSARELDMKEEAQRYINVLNQAKALESYTKSAQNLLNVTDRVAKLLNQLEGHLYG